jgi:hypothetical protein
MRFEVGCGDEESSSLGVLVVHTKPLSCVHVKFTTHNLNLGLSYSWYVLSNLGIFF